MDLRVKKESEDSAETPALWAPSAPSAREELLVTEDSLVLMGCQDLRVLKEIVEYPAHQGQKALLETRGVQENLVYQVQGVLLVLLESREQRASQDHWVPQVKMVVPALQGPLETEGPRESWECQAPRASMVTQERRVNKAQQECQVKEVLLGKMEKLALLAPPAPRASQVTEESRDLQV